MNPKIEVVKMNIQKKGQQVGTFTARLGFDGGFEVVLPGMRIVEGSKGTFVDLPARKFKDVGFVPHYYLNKGLRDLITREALTLYKRKEEEKLTGKTVTTVSPAAAKPVEVKAALSVPPKTWPKKEWKPNSFKK